VTDLRGPIESLLGGRPADWLGRPAGDLVAEQDREVLARALAVRVDATPPVRHPVPFRLALAGPRRTRVEVDALVTMAFDDPAVDGWVLELIPHRSLTSVSEPLELLVAGAPLPAVLASAARALAAPDGGSGRQHTVLLGDRLHDGPAARAARLGNDAVVADPDTPPGLLEAIAATANTGVVPLWRLATPGTRRDLSLDELPLLVSAIARAHGLGHAHLATVEVDGQVEVVLLSFFDDTRWACAQGNWLQRADEVLRILALILTHRRAQERLELAATHDGLTGLANRARFSEALDAYRGDVTVLYADVDRFKTINDRWGHFAGDRVLAEIARRIKAACRAGDLVGRLGGDEFAIALPATATEEALLVARRIIATVTEPLPADIGPERVSVSIGLATGGTDRSTRSGLLDVADRAMYFAKRSGGDRLAVAGTAANSPNGPAAPPTPAVAVVADPAEALATAGSGRGEGQGRIAV